MKIKLLNLSHPRNLHPLKICTYTVIGVDVVTQASFMKIIYHTVCIERPRIGGEILGQFGKESIGKQQAISTTIIELYVACMYV